MICAELITQKVGVLQKIRRNDIARFLALLLQAFLKIPVYTMVAGDDIDENVVSLSCYRHNRVSVIVLWKLVNE